MKSIIPAADASAAPASKSAIAVIGTAKNRIIVSPSKKNRFNENQRPYLRAFRKPRPREGGHAGDWRYQIGNHANLPENVRAFSSEVDAGSHEENASKQESNAPSDFIGTGR
ncbi:hypothetical protein [Bradyrhizobium monzae]|uniref:hypothetical protein n=1 Tax=Bradyrhizobium sp. Oc8 TaxID=2876780 RepID=UPI001F200BED|nr:hypothetical protein [Bradyrhizobium sp. Oc8]